MVRPAQRVASGTTRTPAWWYLVVSGIYLLVTSLAGFAQTADFAIGEGNRVGGERIFGAFETNGWHNLAGLLNGLAAIAFAFTPPRIARIGAISLGIASGAVAILLFVWPSQPLLASNGADQVIHILVAVGGIVAGLATPRVPALPASLTRRR